MDKAAFYATVRKSKTIFGRKLRQQQVDTMDAILNRAAYLDNASVAYIMATAYHEPGPRSAMIPNTESLYYSTAARIAVVWPSRFTKASAKGYARNPQKLANKVYNGRLGNRPGSNDGWTFRGRGLDHLTGRDNYRRASTITGVDLVAKPDLMLEPAIAVESLVHGMTTGRYRGHKLADFIKAGAVDFVGARAIVNADVRANGPMIAGYARAFLNALEISGRKPRPTPIDLPNAPIEPVKPAGFADLIQAILSIFKRGQS